MPVGLGIPVCLWDWVRVRVRVRVRVWVRVIVARVLQLPAFDYNAAHVGVLGVLLPVCILAGIVCTDNTLSALVYPAR